MKKRIGLLVLLFLFVFGFVSCEEGALPWGNKDTGTASAGLTIEFPPTKPPIEIFYNRPFGIHLQLRNFGDYDIPKGKVEIRVDNYEPETLGRTGVVTGSNKFEILANIGSERVELGNNFKLTKQYDSETFETIYAKAVYEYQTISKPKICYRTDLTTDGNCVVEGSKPVQNSIAPVIIENVVAGKYRDGIEVSFDVVDKSAEGDILLAPRENDLFKDKDDYKRKNKVHLTAETNIKSAPKIDCIGFFNSGKRSSGDVEIPVGGSTTMYCDIPYSGNIDIEEDMVITLKYNVYTEITKQLTLAPN
jgi:hypothetical protein